MFTVGMSETVALAGVSLLGYLVGRWRKQRTELPDELVTRRELRRARLITRELDRVTQEVEGCLADHRGSVNAFRRQISKLNGEQNGPAWRELSEAAEEILRPTMRLTKDLQHAYDEIRQQINLLMTFTEVRTDPLTGVSNRRAFDESLRSMFALFTRYGAQFSLAIFDIDHFKKVNDELGHLHGDQILQQVAQLLDEGARETDIVTRYGGEEFVVIMPETNLFGAGVSAERLRSDAARRLPVTISGGVATSIPSDTPETLVQRADAALYAAKEQGRDRVLFHNGKRIESVPAQISSEPPAEPVEAGGV